MKNLFIFSLSFFVYLSGFAQDVEKRYFENDPTLGGDAVIKSSRVKVENDEISKTFEVEILEDGAYYLDAWIMAPLTKEGYPEYKIAINDILSEFTFKPQINDWQGLALTDVKKSPATVNLKRGKNMISVIGKKPEIPNVDFVKLSSNLNRAGISDSKYRQFVESIESNALSDLFNRDSVQVTSGSTRGTSNEIYDYYLNVPVYYSTCMSLNFSAGDDVKIQSMSVNVGTAHIIELFREINPGSYSWAAISSNSGTAKLNVTIPINGTYLLRLQSLVPGGSGIAIVQINGKAYKSLFTQSSQLLEITDNYPTPANFYTCKIKNGGDTKLWLFDNLGNVKAFNDDGGTTSDGYSWGNASRITTNLTDIRYAHISAYSSYNPFFTCDVYMGLSPSTVHGQTTLFPNLPVDNSFRSAPGTGANSVVGPVIYYRGYNCIDWSVGITADSMALGVWNFFDNLPSWDDFYQSYGYTRSGATADNAAIALWMNENDDGWGDDGFTHASVRKNSTIPNPHGFEWESKLGPFERVMHTRDALNNDEEDGYGCIAYYYRPINGTVNSPPVNNTDNTVSTRSLTVSESRFSPSDLNQVAVLKGHIPVIVVSGFEEKYLVWINTWSRPEIAIHSNPYMYAKSSEYESLAQYCMKYGKAIWPLIIEKLAQGNIFVISLLKDVTYNGNPNFGIDIKPSVTVEVGKPYPSLYSILVDYCKGLLKKEDVNILKSIKDITVVEEETFELNVTTTNSGEILLSLHSEKDEKAVVSIYNVFGGLKYEAGYNFTKGSQTVVISTSNFEKGIYIVKITTGVKIKSQTISI